MIIDTHSHIYLEEFDPDREHVINHALNSGVGKILLPNVDVSTIDRMLRVESEFACCQAMMGLHPTSVKEGYLQELATIESALSQRHFCGIGEIGLDLYWDQSHLQEQTDVFVTQLEWASQLNLPVVIHCRDAFPQVFEVVDRLHSPSLRGVFHSFSGGAKELSHIADYQTFKIGINGVVTFKKSDLPEILPAVSPEMVVVETDAPYLAPVPYRGKRNEPAMIRFTIEKLCNIYGLSFKQMEEILEKNARELFDL